jgi:hypothetical protein
LFFFFFRFVCLVPQGPQGSLVCCCFGKVYPGVEYDFVPVNLHLSAGDYVHIQWFVVAFLWPFVAPALNQPTGRALIQTQLETMDKVAE